MCNNIAEHRKLVIIQQSWIGVSVQQSFMEDTSESLQQNG